MKRLIFLCFIFLEISILLFLLSELNLIQILGKFIQIFNNYDYGIPNVTSYWIASNNSKLKLELIPNSEVIWEGYNVKLPRNTTIKINSQGFRDKEYTVNKPENTVRILALGDSFTFGSGVENNETWTEILEEKLNSNLKRKYEVLNFAIPSYGTENEVELFKVKGIKYDPDIVIIGHTFDDIYNFTRMDELEIEIATRYNNSKDQIVQIQISEECYKRLDEEFKSMDFQEAFLTIENPLKDLAHVYNKTVIIVSLTLYPLQPAYKDSLVDVSKQFNWHFIDMWPIYSKYDRRTLCVHPIDKHPNPLAHKIIATAIFNYMIRHNLV